MQKRIFSLFLVLAMLLSFVVMPASAAGESMVTDVTENCPCGCGKKLQEVEWKVWAENPNAGHYYLEKDYVQSGQITVLSDTPVVLDLRGQ